VSSKS